MSTRSYRFNEILEAVKSLFSIDKRERNTYADGKLLHNEGCKVPGSVADVLSKFEIDVNAKNHEGDTLLNIALRNNDSAQVIKELLLLGASIMTRDFRGFTPLHNLLDQEEPDIETVTLLLDYKADVNARNEKEETPFHILLQKRKCKPEVVQLLLQYGVDVTAKDYNMCTPLQYFFLYGDLDIQTVTILLDEASSKNLKTPLHTLLLNKNCKSEVVKLLLEYGAGVTAKGNKHCNPLLSYLRYHDEPEIETVRLLLHYKSDVNATEGILLQTPLHYVVEHDCQADVVELLLKYGADVKAKDLIQYEPLHYICGNASLDIETVRLLLDYNSDVNATTEYCKKTPLHILLENRNCQPEVVKLLLECGADVTAEDDDHCTPLLCYLLCQIEPEIETVRLLLDYRSDMNARTENLKTPLHMLLQNRNCKPEVVKLLLEFGAAVAAEDDDHCTPLLCYLRYQIEPEIELNIEPEIETVRLLLDYRSDMNARTKKLKTPLHMLLQNRNCKPEVVKLLLEYGAAVAAEDDDHCTPLLCYLQCQIEPEIELNKEPEIETVRLLLEYKADVNAKDKNLQTPLHYFYQNKFQTEVVELLLKYGADVRSKDKLNRTPVDIAIEYGNVIMAKVMINYTLINKYDGVWRDVIDIKASVDNELYTEMVTHISQCVGETDVMKEHRVNDKFSFYDWYRFVNRRLVPKPLYTKEIISEDLISKLYPVYGCTLWTIIRHCLDRADMFNQLEELQSTDVFKNLGADCLREIVEHLPNNDLLNFISALRSPVLF